VKAITFERNIVRYGAARIASIRKAGLGAVYGPLSLDNDATTPVLPGADWLRVRPLLAGICGSDLATVDGRSSRYFETIVSMPFTPGHEVVGELDDGRRVVIEPVLGCVTRGITPPCPQCASGRLGRCERISFGSLKAGLQSGFCCETGGGWSTSMVVHPSQVHEVPAGFSDEDAVMVEPTACAVHAALSPGSLGGADGDGVVAVIGAGTLGLLTTAAIAAFNPARHIIVAAKYPEQERHAKTLGATATVDPSALIRAVRTASKSLAIGDGGLERLTGGADVVFDCVGNDASITQALRIAKPGSRIVLVGMPASVTVDLTPLWHREISLVGAYAYGVEPLMQGRRTFDLAIELVGAKKLGGLVSATYSLDEYEDAIAHAASAGKRGAVKIAFDMRAEKARNR
jgi:threonine dehydrogenase-like Zn-dependent dehydrogenase